MDRDLSQNSTSSSKSRKFEIAENLKSQTGPVIWAVDPFDSRLGQLQPIQKALRVMKLDNEIVPVAVTSIAEMNFAVPLGTVKDDFSKSIYHGLLKLFKKLEPKKKLEPQILIESGSSRRKLVHAVVNFATEKKASLIAVNTHAKKGLSRLGSFSELLIAISPLPVLALNPKAKLGTKISTILFPTEFSEASKKAFDLVLEKAKDWKSKVIIFHKVTLPPVPMAFEGAYMNAQMVDDYFRTWKLEMRDQAEAWKRYALERGVKCEALLHEKQGTVEACILKEAKKQNADIIALATYEGPVAQAILGSTASDILINATRPVLVLHTK